MIKTTMSHKSGRTPSVMAKNIPGNPSSKSVIRTTMSKPSCKADGFVYKTKSCKTISGGPGTKFVDSGK